MEHGISKRLWESGDVRAMYRRCRYRLTAEDVEGMRACVTAGRWLARLSAVQQVAVRPINELRFQLEKATGGERFAIPQSVRQHLRAPLRTGLHHVQRLVPPAVVKACCQRPG